jgi:hypothetical protein
MMTSLLSTGFPNQEGTRNRKVELQGWRDAKETWHRLTASDANLSSDQVESAYRLLEKEWENLDAIVAASLTADAGSFELSA